MFVDNDSDFALNVPLQRNRSTGSFRIRSMFNESASGYAACRLFASERHLANKITHNKTLLERRDNLIRPNLRDEFVEVSRVTILAVPPG